MRGKNVRRLIGRRLIGVCGSFASLASASPAFAQEPARPASAGVVTPATGARRTGAAPGSVDRWAGVLGLDAAQTQAAKDLSDAHRKAVASAGRTVRDALQEAQEDASAGDHAAFERRINDAMQKLGERTRAMNDAFLADLRALLRPEQEANWPRFERLRRRETNLVAAMGPGSGGLGGSDIDLTLFMRRIEVPAEARPRVDEALVQYEEDIDLPLRERERNSEDDRKGMGAVQRFTPETFQKRLDRDRDVDLKIRAVNDRYVERLASLLSDEMAAKLRDEYRQKAYRAVYRATGAGKNLAAARALQGLTPEQKGRLAALQDAYRRDAKAAADRWAAALRRAEDAGKPTGRGPMLLGPGLGGRDDIDPDVADARAARRAVDERLKGDMEKILTPDQLAAARDAASTPAQGGLHQVEVVGDGAAGDVTFVSELEIDEDDLPPAGPGGAPMVIIRTIEDVRTVPTPTPTPTPTPSPGTPATPPAPRPG